MDLVVRRSLLSASPSFRYSSSTYLRAAGLLLPGFLHTDAPPNLEMPVNCICDSLRKGRDWDSLSRSFGHLVFDSLLVDKVLLELNKPIDAKSALGFFHWSAQLNKKNNDNLVHGVRSYCLIVHICVRARLIMDAQALVDSLLKKTIGKDDTFLVVDSMLDTYRAISCSTPLVFDLLVQGCAKLRMFEIGFDVCCYLDEHGFSCSLATFNILLHVVQKSDKPPMVWTIYEHMIARKIYPNEATTKTVINALCKEGKLQTFIDMLNRIHGKRCAPSVIVNTCLLFRILEEGRIEAGMALLKRMLQKNMILDSVAYSLVAYAKIKRGNLDSALEVFEEMQKKGFGMNSFVYTSFIGAYCKEGRIEKASQLLLDMENKGLKPYLETFNFLVEYCAKAGKVGESLHHCEKMMDGGLIPSLSAFNEMVGNISEICDANRANMMLTHLLDKGFVPNEVTYSYLMAVYGRKNQLQEVLKLYYEIKHRSFSPGLLAFTSLIKTLCGCGKLEEAEKYLRAMKDHSLNPNEDIYGTLITGYLCYGDKSRAYSLYNETCSKGFKPLSKILT